jgi:hypothetical protein
MLNDTIKTPMQLNHSQAGRFADISKMGATIVANTVKEALKQAVVKL